MVTVSVDDVDYFKFNSKKIDIIEYYWLFGQYRLLGWCIIIQKVSKDMRLPYFLSAFYNTPSI